MFTKGISRQEAHERVGVLSLETVKTMKLDGVRNDLIERIKKDEFFVNPFRHGLLLGLIMAFTEAYTGLSW